MKVRVYLQNCDFGHKGYLRLSAEEFEHLREMCRTHPESVIEIHGDYVEEGGKTSPMTVIVPVHNIVAVCAESDQVPRKRIPQHAYLLD